MKRYLLIGLVLLLSLVAGCGGEAKQPEGPVTLSATADGFTGTLEISPGTVGPNTFTASVTDANKKLVSGGQAALHFGMQGMEHGKSEMELKKTPDGKWSGEGPNLMMGGEWQLQLVWVDDAGKSHPFDYTLKLAD